MKKILSIFIFSIVISACAKPQTVIPLEEIPVNDATLDLKPNPLIPIC